MVLATTEKQYTVKTADGRVVGKAALRSVPVAAIKIDSDYQRDVSQQWLSDHMPFDPQKAGTAVLSERGGALWCVDGGHRIGLARASGVSHINAFVIQGLTKKEEARLFTLYQRERRNLTSFALFRADIVAEDPDTLALVTAVNTAGFHIAKKSGDLNITAIDSLRAIQRIGGIELLGVALRLVKRTWLGEAKALAGTTLKGLALFIQHTKTFARFDQARLDKVMEAHAPVKVNRVAQSVANKRNATDVSAANVADALLELYNKTLSRTEAAAMLPPLVIGKKRRPAPRTAK